MNQNKDTKLTIVLFLIFVTLTFIYFLVNTSGDLDKSFLTLSTFLFALFSGFMISRQSARYGTLKKALADFDGDMSSIYRAFGYFDKNIQDEAGKIILKYYEDILKFGWDYPLKYKTTTIIDLNELTKTATAEYGTDGIKGSVVSRILFVLSGTQRVRKEIASLYTERTPALQWFVIYLLAIILASVVTLSLDSQYNIVASFVKSAFVSSIVMVLVLLKRLDGLVLFGDMVGKKSAEDTVAIIKGER